MSNDASADIISSETVGSERSGSERNETLDAPQRATQRRSSLIITVPDPDEMEPEIWADVGGTLQWRSETHFYPYFEVHFLGKDPCGGKDSCFRGNDVAPVVIRPEIEGEFKYEIWQFKSPGSHPKKHPPKRFKVRSCFPCQP